MKKEWVEVFFLCREPYRACRHSLQGSDGWPCSDWGEWWWALARSWPRLYFYSGTCCYTGSCRPPNPSMHITCSRWRGGVDGDMWVVLRHSAANKSFACSGARTQHPENVTPTRSPLTHRLVLRVQTFLRIFHSPSSSVHLDMSFTSQVVITSHILLYLVFIYLLMSLT